MKTKKRYVLLSENYLQRESLETYLDEMAKQGWRLKSLGFLMQFEKALPAAEEEYAVEVFLKNSENDFVPNENTEEFADYCSAAGWEFVDSFQKYVVFRKLRSDAVSITTPSEKIQNVFHAELNKRLTLFIGMAALFLLFGFFLTRFPEHLFNPAMPVPLFLSAFETVVWGIKMIYLLLWYKKAKDRKADSETAAWHKPYFAGEEVFTIILFVLIFAAYLVFMIGNEKHLVFIVPVLLPFITGPLSRIRRFNAGERFVFVCILSLAVLVIAVSVLVSKSDFPESRKTTVYNEEVPLELPDVYSVQERGTIGQYFKANSFFGSRLSYQLYDEEYTEESNRTLTVHLFDCSFEWVKELVWENYVKRNQHTVPGNAGLWEAEEVLVKADTYYICYPSAVHILSVKEPLTEKQIITIKNKLENR